MPIIRRALVFPLHDAVEDGAVLLPLVALRTNTRRTAGFPVRTLKPFWPSLQNQRRIDDFSPYLLLESTLEECLRVLMKPSGTLHLYEIHTAPQLPLVIEGVLSGEHVAELARPRELARLRDFL